MMGQTSIAWTDRSVNPLRARNVATGSVGHYCEKIAPGCAHCYASAWNARVRPTKNGVGIGTGLPYLPKLRSRLEFFLDRSKLAEVSRRRIPTKWFWCDMTDLFGEWVSDEWIAACYATMWNTPRHTHQVLTKRGARRAALLASPAFHGLVMAEAQALVDVEAKKIGVTATIGPRDFPWPLPNVWEMVSVSNQEDADRGVPILLQTPAAVRGVSYEPAIGPIDFTHILVKKSDAPERGKPDVTFDALRGWYGGVEEERTRLDWLIVGGESGMGARPCDVAWIRSAVEQCRGAGVPVFVKQLGARPVMSTSEWLDWCDREGWAPEDAEESGSHHIVIPNRDRKGGNPSEWPTDLRVREFPR